MTSSVLSPPAPTEHSAYFGRYIGRVSETDAGPVLAAQIDEVASLYRNLPPGKADFAYAPGKWSLKEVLGHLTDTERVLVYRAMVAARADTTPLPPFDENAWVPPAGFGARSVESLLEEWIAVRRATIAFFAGLPDAAAGRLGVASGQPLSPRAVAYIVPGHVRHHLAVIRERYLEAGSGPK